MNPIDAHIATQPPAVQTRLQAVRQTVAALAPLAVETLSYGIPTFDLHGRHLIHFAGFAHHIGLYPGADGIAAHLDLLRPYKYAKGSVQFPHDQPLPLDLIAAMARYRIGVVERQASAKPKRQKPSKPPG